MAKVDQTKLYINLVRRIRKENLPSYVQRGLDEAQFRLENEKDELRLHQILISPLKDMLNNPKKQHAANNNNQKPNYVKQIENFLGTALNAQNAPLLSLEYDGAKARPEGKGGKKQNSKDKFASSGQGKQANAQTGQQKKDKSAGQVGESTPDQRTKNSFAKRKFFKFVQPWPMHAKYTATGGRTLTKECEAHFNGFCFKCGQSSHEGKNCKIYSNQTVLTICSKCNRGFHDKCKKL